LSWTLRISQPSNRVQHYALGQADDPLKIGFSAGSQMRLVLLVRS
jgi:hypothetical protein